MAALDPYIQRVVRAHRRSALIRAGSSLVMWLFAAVAFLTGVIHAEHFAGVTVAVAFLVLMNPPNLWGLTRIRRAGPLDAFCVAIHTQEILGYTAIIHFLGGIEAAYLALLYGALIASVGLVSVRYLPYVLAAISSAAFGLMAVLEHAGLLARHPVVTRPDRPWNDQVTIIGVVAGLLFVTAYITVVNARLVRRSRDTLRAAAEMTEGSMRLLFASGPLPMIVWEWETLAILEANEQTLAHYGYTREEVLTKRLTDFLLPEDIPRLHALRQEQALTGRQGILASGPWRTVRRDGSIIEVELFAHPIVFAGRTARMGVLIDVTERRRAEEEARRLAAIVQASDDAIVSVGLDGTVLSWNPGAERMYGYATHDAVGMPFRRLTPADRPDDTDDILRRIAGGDVIERHEVVQVARDGHRVDVALKVSPIRDAAGTVTAASVIARDVTERKRLEESFREAQKMEAVGQLAGGVAHDFNNNLTVILGGLESLAERVEPVMPDMAATLAQVNHAAERSAEFTRQLLAFGRRQPLQPRVLDVNRLVLKMGSLLRRTLGATIGLDLVPAPALWKTEADPGQLESALLNLALNARDAMPRGGTLTIETGNASLDPEYAALNADVRPGQYVMVAVSDTGMGMTAEVRDRAFEPFFTTKGPGHGTGLGLSMVYGFVKQSGGHVKIDSEVGEGSTIRLYLPRVHRRAEAPAPAPAALPVGHETILIVEDEPEVRAVVARHLGDMGYRLLEAADAMAALALLATPQRIHVLFTDVVLPGGMSGRELADEARRLRPELKVLFTSGYTSDAIVHHGRIDEGVDFLGKPYKRADLARKLREVLERE
jgi:PAS domain S-box-containing protein